MKKYPVTRPSLPPLEEYLKMIATVWDNHKLTNGGPLRSQFQTLVQETFKMEQLSVCSSGHMALLLAIRALRMQDPDPEKYEVITTPFSFSSTTQVILENGLRPVFCDIKEDDYTIDTSKIRNLITEHTWGIAPVHPYGNLCDVDEIERIAKENNLHVIYDAAHAFGICKDGKSIATLGDATCFSLHATKSMQAVEGGVACFRDHTSLEMFEKLCNFGLSPCGISTLCGCNAKIKLSWKL